MYLPDPLFELVLSYVTDGQPARRVLARCGRDQVVKGWKSADSAEFCMWVANGTWFSNWGAIRRALDIAAHVVASEEAGREHIANIALILPDRFAGERDAIARVRRALQGEWVLFPPGPLIAAFGTWSPLSYEYSPPILVTITSVSSYLNFSAYAYFVSLLDRIDGRPEMMQELRKREGEGKGRVL
jgi:hypothetical protein